MLKFLAKLILKSPQKPNNTDNEKVQHLKKLGVSVSIVGIEECKSEDIYFFGRVEDKYPDLKIK